MNKLVHGPEALAECAEDHSAASGAQVTAARCSILPFNNRTQPRSPWQHRRQRMPRRDHTLNRTDRNLGVNRIRT